MIATVVVLMLGFGAINLIPVDKVVYRPGPVFDTLGEGAGGADMIEIDGLETYPTDGAFALTTVQVYGGPGQRVSVWDWIQAEFNGEETVVPREHVYPDEVTREDITTRNEQAMVSSQSDAEIVALRAAGIPERIAIASVNDDGPSDGVLEPGDVLVSVDGVDIAEGPDAQDALQEVEEGTEIDVVVDRDGTEHTVGVTPERAEVEVAEGEFEERVLIGVMLTPVFDGDFTIEFNAGAVGGPSAGLMFSLAIYDMLTPGELAGGLTFAGTGTIGPGGDVGGIGGVTQKMVAAEQEGYDYFLAPEENCGEVRGNEPEGIEVLAIADFDQAREVVEGLAAGEDVDLPRC